MSEIEKKQNIEFLLPFYLNETLQGEEKMAVEQALAEDESLRDELLFLQKLQGHLQQPSQSNSPGELGLKRLQRSIKQQSTPPEQSVNRWRIATIAACLMLVVQTTNNISQTDTYQTAGGKAEIQYKGQLMSVTFAPDATEQSIRKLLMEANASIVDGPSALGIYYLLVPGNAEHSKNILKANSNVIESIQEEQ